MQKAMCGFCVLLKDMDTIFSVWVRVHVFEGWIAFFKR